MRYQRIGLRSRLVIVSGILFVLLFPQEGAAGVEIIYTVYPTFGVEVTVKIYGKITSEDYKHLDRALIEGKKLSASMNLPFYDAALELTLNSPGGEVQAAMSIGRWARRRQAVATVEQGECSSACVLILAGAVDRLIERGGKIGIHRSFIEGLKPNLPYEDVRRLMVQMQEQIESYLREMDIPISLLEEMKSIPPGKIRYLTPAEQERFRLSGRDPAYEEQLDAQEASRFGISREEYYRRTARIKQVCPPPGKGYGKCRREVLEGKR